MGHYLDLARKAVPSPEQSVPPAVPAEAERPPETKPAAAKVTSPRKDPAVSIKTQSESRKDVAIEVTCLLIQADEEGVAVCVDGGQLKTHCVNPIDTRFLARLKELEADIIERLKPVAPPEDPYDLIGQITPFFADACLFSTIDDMGVSKCKMCDVYELWAKSHGTPALSNRLLEERLRERGCTESTFQGELWWDHVSIHWPGVAGKTKTRTKQKPKRAVLPKFLEPPRPSGEYKQLLNVIARCPSAMWSHYCEVHKALHARTPGLDIREAVELAWAETLRWGAQQKQGKAEQRKDAPGRDSDLSEGADGTTDHPKTPPTLWEEDRHGVG